VTNDIEFDMEESGNMKSLKTFSRLAEGSLLKALHAELRSHEANTPSVSFSWATKDGDLVLDDGVPESLRDAIDKLDAALNG
jgi:hypothetical protein